MLIAHINFGSGDLKDMLQLQHVTEKVEQEYIKSRHGLMYQITKF
jgi:hypothetical protein